MTNEAWLSSLYEAHYALLYRVGRVFFGVSCADIIEDQIQETFILAWRHEQKLMEHPNPGGWLVETFRRCLMAQCRKQGREKKWRAFSLDEEGQPDIADQSTLSVEDLLRSKDQMVMLRRLLGEQDADIFLRYCIHGENAAQVAAKYDMTESGVRVRVSRLKKKLLINKELFLCVVSLLAFGLGMK